MSQHLSNCNFSWTVFNLVKNEGRSNGIVFEWIEGVTSQEWIRTNSKKTFNSGVVMPLEMVKLEKAITLAMSVSEAIAGFYESGVVHNNITADNIIIPENKNY
eukprot:1769058-Ditylum_brightwellii.AAC.1